MTDATTISVEKIFEILPHRYPFLLVDRVIEFTPEQTLHAIKNVTINEPFFNGHFPNKPVMPGVLIIEALAQASGILAHYSDPERRPSTTPQIYLLAGVDNARFKRIVEPGDRLDLHVTFERAKRGICKFKCEARVDGTIACAADIIAAKKEDAA